MRESLSSGFEICSERLSVLSVFFAVVVGESMTPYLLPLHRGDLSNKGRTEMVHICLLVFPHLIPGKVRICRKPRILVCRALRRKCGEQVLPRFEGEHADGCPRGAYAMRPE